MVDKAVHLEDSRRELEESHKRKMMQHGAHQSHPQRARLNVQHPGRFAPPATFRTPATVPRPAAPAYRSFSNNNPNN